MHMLLYEYDCSSERMNLEFWNEFPRKLLQIGGSHPIPLKIIVKRSHRHGYISSLLSPTPVCEENFIFLPLFYPNDDMCESIRSAWD